MTRMTVTLTLTIDQAMALKETLEMRRDQLIAYAAMVNTTEAERAAYETTCGRLSDILLHF